MVRSTSYKQFIHPYTFRCGDQKCIVSYLPNITLILLFINTIDAKLLCRKVGSSMSLIFPSHLHLTKILHQLEVFI